jgi:hypothetical protein
MRQRPEIIDKEFYQRFYGDSGIPEDIPLRLRGVYAEQLGINRLLPHDKATDFDEELDFGELLFDVAAEFSIDFSEEEVTELAEVGTFDAVVRCVASKPLTKRDELYFHPACTDVVGKALQRRRSGMLIGLLVAGLVVIVLGVGVGRLEEVVPGLALITKVVGIGLVVLALSRGEYRVKS